MASRYGKAPNFRYVKDQSRKAALTSLRSAVAPLLDNNILPHYTNHSVFHSDNLIEIVSKLVEPLGRGKHKLNDHELTILYSACFLHDIGMHNEVAGNTSVMQKAIEENKYKMQWEELQLQTRAKLIRDYHHLVSAEMIRQSVLEAQPLVGIQLTDVYDPGRIASICEAHCTVFNSNRYSELTQDGPEIRMGLLAGLLRIADILDDTRPRAERAKSRLLDLDIESKIHWWRHYYTEQVTLDTKEKAIVLWFDFPFDRVVEYSKIIPQLQMPWIEKELSNQASVFNANGLNWHLSSKISMNEYGSAEKMPDDVQTAMLKEFHRKQLSQAEEQRITVLQNFAEAQPLISRRLDELNKKKDTTQPTNYIREVSKLVDDMWALGAKRSSWMTLYSAYNQYKDKMVPKERIEMGIKLASMMMSDESNDMASKILFELQSDIETIDNREKSYEYWELSSRCYFDICTGETTDAIKMALKDSPSETAKESLMAMLSEWHFFQTDLNAALATGDKVRESK